MVRNSGRVVKRKEGSSASQPLSKKRKVQQTQQPSKTDEVEILRRELKELEQERRKMGEHLLKEERRLKRETVRYENEAEDYEKDLQISIQDFEADIRNMKKENARMKLEEKEHESFLKLVEKARETDIADEEQAFQSEDTISQDYVKRMNDLKQKVKNADLTTEAETVAKNVCEKCQLEFRNDGNKERVPKILPCGHTACLACIEELCVDGHIRCPFDRLYMKIDGSSLPTNFAAI